MNKKNVFNSPKSSLPPIGVVVEALCCRKTNWPSALGGTKVTEEKHLVRRIKTNDNAKGWQWSHPELKTYFTLEVLSWQSID